MFFISTTEARDCSVVNISSVQAHRAKPWDSGWTYQASKGAVTTMTKCMALDLSADEIRVNSISPGYTWTEQVWSHARWLIHYISSSVLRGGLLGGEGWGRTRRKLQIPSFCRLHHASSPFTSRIFVSPVFSLDTCSANTTIICVLITTTVWGPCLICLIYMLSSTLLGRKDDIYWIFLFIGTKYSWRKKSPWVDRCQVSDEPAFLWGCRDSSGHCLLV